MSFIKPIAAVAALSITALAFAAPADARSRHHHRHHGHHGHHGDALAAGVFGFAAGALIAGAIAQPQPRTVYAPSDWVAYCSSKYRSYNPATNLFVGYDGYYHECR